MVPVPVQLQAGTAVAESGGLVGRRSVMPFFLSFCLFFCLVFFSFLLSVCLSATRVGPLGHRTLYLGSKDAMEGGFDGPVLVLVVVVRYHRLIVSASTVIAVRT